MTATEHAYKAALRSKVLGALQIARAASGVTHPALKGRMREILISDIFRPLLPPDIGICSGQVIECLSGKLSRQQDVILYDSSIIAPFVFDPSAAIVPIEAVLYVIDVKSLLSKIELQSAHDSARELNNFIYMAPTQSGVIKLNSVLFALKSSLDDDPVGEPRRYRAVYGTDYPFIKALCVASKCYWYENSGSWVMPKGSLEGDEVLAFIGGVTNSY